MSTMVNYEARILAGSTEVDKLKGGPCTESMMRRRISGFARDAAKVCEATPVACIVKLEVTMTIVGRTGQ